ncbi:MAG TPA: hypothetical protein VJ547_03525 [Candidatus Thermoplasmatota archaeon]|nr:hypothetical protein [Candidatus Thermoplasmatota archaeon]
MREVPAAVELEAVQAALRALANRTRQQILVLLLPEPRGLPYGEIARRLGFAEPSAIDQHLKSLASATLVGNRLERVDGRIRSVYRISAWGREWMDRCGLAAPANMRLLLQGVP